MTKITLAAVAVLIAAALGAIVYGIGRNDGAASVQQQWDNDKTKQAQAVADQATTTRTKESTHADKITEAVDNYQAARTPAAADAAERIARAERLQRTAEGRAAQYLAMSQAGNTERSRLASHAARLDASLADGRRVAEQLRATVVERDQQIRLLADVIRADRALAGHPDAPTDEPEP